MVSIGLVHFSKAFGMRCASGGFCGAVVSYLLETSIDL